MREIRSQKPKKPKQSKFFDQLIQKYGEQYALDKCTNQEISDKLRFFIQDLVYGNILQDKYIQYIMNDTNNRLIGSTLVEIDYRIKRAAMISYALSKLYASQDPITQDQEFQQCYMDEDLKSKAYSIIKQGLLGFLNSRDPQYIEWIAIQFNSPILRSAKQLI